MRTLALSTAICPPLSGWRSEIQARRPSSSFQDLNATAGTTEFGARSGHCSCALEAPRKFHDHAGCQCIFGFLASLPNRRYQLTLRVAWHLDDCSEHDGFHEIVMHGHCTASAVGSSEFFRRLSTSDRRLAVSTSVELPSLMISISRLPMST